MSSLPRSWFAVLLLAAGIAGQADAAPAGCGTVIVPTGVGQSAPADISSLSPLLTTSLYSHEIIDQFYRPLVWIDRHGRPDPSRSIAASVDTPDDGRSFLVTLHDWRWSDGVPITADDLVSTLDLVRRMGPGYAFDGTGGVPNLIASWQAVSPHQVVLRMTRKVNPAWFVSEGLGNVLYPLPRHVYAGLDTVELRRRQTDASLFAVGDGPFVLKSLVLGRYAVLEPNPLYGGEHPHIRRLVISFPIGNAALEQFRSGALDMVNVPYLLGRFAQALGNARIVHLVPVDSYGEGIYNFRSARAPFLADPAVRRAITRGIDQAEISALVFHGQAPQLHGPVPASMADLQSDAARAGYPDLSFDPAAASALLAADGWSRGADGILHKGAQRLAFSITTSSESPPGVMMAQVIQRDLKRIGIDVSIETMGFNQLLATMIGDGHPWDFGMLNWTIDTYPDTHDFFSSDGTGNWGGYRDAAMDAANSAVMFGSGDGPTRASQDRAAEQMPYLFLPVGTPEVLVRPGIGGITEFLSPNGMWSAEKLTLEGPLACPTDTAQLGTAHAAAP